MNITILTLVLMVSTHTNNRAMTTVTMEYANKAACEKALTEHVNSVKSQTYRAHAVNVVLANCTSKS